MKDHKFHKSWIQVFMSITRETKIAVSLKLAWPRYFDLFSFIVFPCISLIPFTSPIYITPRVSYSRILLLSFSHPCLFMLSNLPFHSFIIINTRELAHTPHTSVSSSRCWLMAFVIVIVLFWIILNGFHQRDQEEEEGWQQRWPRCLCNLIRLVASLLPQNLRYTTINKYPFFLFW